MAKSSNIFFCIENFSTGHLTILKPPNPSIKVSEVRKMSKKIIKCLIGLLSGPTSTKKKPYVLRDWLGIHVPWCTAFPDPMFHKFWASQSTGHLFYLVQNCRSTDFAALELWIVRSECCCCAWQMNRTGINFSRLPFFDDLLIHLGSATGAWLI